MTVPTIPLTELPFQLPDLAQHAALLAIVPTDGGAEWAPAMAWAVARAAATLGRRTLLVDCFVDAPRLHLVAGATNDEGIVDAFDYGASLTRVAQRQPEPDLYFVPAGTFASDPAALLANRRWGRLAAGFRHEGALLLLYTPAPALPCIIGESDAALILAPAGYDFARDASGGLVEAAGSGRPLLVVVPGDAAPVPAALAGFEPTAGAGFGTDAAGAGMTGLQSAADAAAVSGPPPVAPGGSDAPVEAAPAEGAAVAAADGAPDDGAPPRPAIRRIRPPFRGLDAVSGPPPRTRRSVVYLGVVVVAAALAVVAVRPEWILPAPPEEEAPAPRPSARRTGSLPWMVQVSAWPTPERALAEVDTLRLHGVRSIVTPVRVGSHVSYRVHAGPLADKSAADWLLDSLRASHRADPVGSVAVQVPLSFHFDSTAMTPVRAAALGDTLRAGGISTFLLAQADGRVHLYAGAFEGREEAAVLDSLLQTLGRERYLGVRVGHRP